MATTTASPRRTMKAYVYREYGGPDVVRLEDVPKPLPKSDEILVRIVATTVTAGDWRVRTLDAPKGFGTIARLALGVTRPRQPIMGTELAGVVESVGPGVARFAAGNAVVAFPGGKMGAHAEYCAIREDGCVARKPANLSFEEAAALPFGACTALHFLREARVARGERVLVVGASGNVGTALVQLAKLAGAHVTGVTSGPNAGLVASLGADEVVDYTREDVTAAGESFDVVMDTVGARPRAAYRPIVRDGGRFVAIAGGLTDMLATMRPAGRRGVRVIAGPAAERPEYLAEVARLAEAGALRPVVDRSYDFGEMREAHAYVETRRKRGSVVVRVGAALR